MMSSFNPVGAYSVKIIPASERGPVGSHTVKVIPASEEEIDSIGSELIGSECKDSTKISHQEIENVLNGEKGKLGSHSVSSVNSPTEEEIGRGEKSLDHAVDSLNKALPPEEASSEKFGKWQMAKALLKGIWGSSAVKAAVFGILALTAGGILLGAVAISPLAFGIPGVVAIIMVSTALIGIGTIALTISPLMTHIEDEDGGEETAKSQNQAQNL